MPIQENIKKQIKEKEIKLLNELSKGQDISTDIVIKLRVQDELLGTVKNEVEAINNKLSFSEKIINNMKNMFYFLDTAPEKDHDDKDNKENKENKENKNFQKYTDTNIQKNISELDTLDIALQRLKIIKNNAEMQNVLLCEQNEKLGNIASNADDAMNKIEKLNKDIRKV